MRVIWKDSKPEEYKPVKYRKHMIYGSPEGWYTTIPGDNNLYASNFCAMNAIDQAFGDFGQKGTEKRINYGIKIVGQKNDSA